MNPSNIYQEIDTTPVELPTRLKLPQNRTDQIRAFIRHELSQKAAFEGMESFEEADDLEPDDEENLPLTPYELMELEPPTPLQTGVAAQPQAPVDPAPKPEEPSPAPAPGGSDGTK